MTGVYCHQFEKHGINFEAAIECCCGELEENEQILACAIYWSYDELEKIKMHPLDDMPDAILVFSRSAAGRKIAAQLIEKIRSCDNWEELYDVFHYTNKFYNDVMSGIEDELE